MRAQATPRIMIQAGIGSSAAADIVIAAISIGILSRRRTGIKTTDDTIQLIMKYAFHTGAVTSLCSIVVIFLFNVVDSNVFVGLSLVTNKRTGHYLLRYQLTFHFSLCKFILVDVCVKLRLPSLSKLTVLVINPQVECPTHCMALERPRS
ncbi:hypothetical protein NLI96_g10482 [Meripilus lineatus]|uniref:DUF6534 domain-containing protein n=1 Tax=Meripilus lineatus TaxID=2056292 RepID=A0AAD5UTJ0_9APHY|nr:hypothetical protein NLI96_g10482 [Physisporinus lineatus]